jgi:hypothetical protein
VEENTLNELIESATYWYREYIQTLRSGDEEKAETAYRRYTEYKEEKVTQLEYQKQLCKYEISNDYQNQ